MGYGRDGVQILVAGSENDCFDHAYWRNGDMRSGASLRYVSNEVVNKAYQYEEDCRKSVTITVKVDD